METSQQYAQFTVGDFDHFDCLKISKGIYFSLLFILRGYIIWIVSITNMNNKVALIEWLYPDPAMFYLSLVTGLFGLYLLLIISLRRPNAAHWIKISWKYYRRITILALLFDLTINVISFLNWQFVTFSWLIFQIVLVTAIIFILYNNKRINLNLQEFPETIIKS